MWMQQGLLQKSDAQSVSEWRRNLAIFSKPDQDSFLFALVTKTKNNAVAQGKPKKFHWSFFGEAIMPHCSLQIEWLRSSVGFLSE
eukprot:6986676-Karenia_brevis.AAC.1